MGNLLQDLQGDKVRHIKKSEQAPKQLLMKGFTDSFFAHTNTPKKTPTKIAKTSTELSEEEKRQIEELFGKQDIS